ncbi:MAG: co-chaperone GroES [Chloroflexi bacterium]|nr:co-chaperone GroES [Chloroflexota bacterium]
MGRTFIPMNDRILVKPVERKEVSSGGIYLPDTATEKPQEGEVIAVGEGRLTDEGKRIALDIKVGDIVLYSKYGGTELKEDGDDLLILNERDVLAKIS